MAEDVSQRIRNELTRLYAAINETANRAVVTSDDIQYFINWLEHFHRHLLRLSESGFVTPYSVRILQDVLNSLRDMPEDFATSGPNIHIYREKPLGRPRYFLSREQLVRWPISVTAKPKLTATQHELTATQRQLTAEQRQPTAEQRQLTAEQRKFVTAEVKSHGGSEIPRRKAVSFKTRNGE
ncbi:hypothetical protein OS493_019573 [Desmophyllum pertusum]|uniref:Uncharacterized protein n=1 Tax=Desmophyllum pertusum TaxID=174260 RepID=A0A9W9ZNF0_9CNID|nr:hypothetical protein OS493_019573 [Desmophyllum pertusum]